MHGETTCPGKDRRWLGRLELLALFAAGLNLPKISTGVALVLIAAHLFGWVGRAHPTVRTGFALRLMLLSLFAVSYYALWVSHGLGDFATARKSVLIIVGFYAIGFAAGGERGEAQALWRAFAVVSGLVVFVSLSVWTMPEAGSVAGIATRTVPSIWDPDDVMNAPGLGAICSLGMCLLPAALLAPAPPGAPRWAARTFRALAVLLAGAGAYCNLLLLNRTPILSLAIALFGTVLLVGWSGRPAQRRVAVLVGGAVVAIAVVLLAVDDTLGASFGLFERFQERGLDTERYATWRVVLQGLWSHLDGGRRIDLHGQLYAHDLWLDVAYDVGLLPLVLLLLFQASHLGTAWRSARSTSFLNLALAGLGVSYLGTFLVEPTLQFSVVYFATSCFFLGVLLRRGEVQPRVVEDAPAAPRLPAGVGVGWWSSPPP